MKYERFSYLYPPRPDNPIDPGSLWNIEQRGWSAQYKKNGQCSVVAVSPERKLTIMNRHKAPHKNWSAPAGAAAAFQKLPGAGWYVFVGELLHAKGIGVKDTHYLFDILVADSKFLFGSTFHDRVPLLNGLFPDTREEAYSHRVIDDHTWVARTFEGNLLGLYDQAVLAGDEGIVMKDPNGVLSLCTREGANNGWQLKCRSPTKNFRF